MPENTDIDHLASLLKNVKISEVMTAPAKTVPIDEDFAVVEETFVNHKIRHLPIVDGNKKLIGIISQRDVYRAVAPRRFVDGKVHYREGIIVDEDGYYEKESLNQYILNHIMHKNPKACTKDQPLGDAIQIMVNERIGSVPVVNDKKQVVGIITRFDILEHANQVYESYLEKEGRK